MVNILKGYNHIFGLHNTDYIEEEEKKEKYYVWFSDISVQKCNWICRQSKLQIMIKAAKKQ